MAQATAPILDSTKLTFELSLEFGDERLAAFLADDAALVGTASPDHLSRARLLC